MVSVHNSHMYLKVMADVRAAIAAGTFAEFRREFIANYAAFSLVKSPRNSVKPVSCESSPNAAAIQKRALQWQRAGHAHRLCADDGLFARRPFEPRARGAQTRRHKRQSRRQHLRQPDAVRAEGRSRQISARLETRFEIVPRSEGVDVVFTPSDAEMYPVGKLRRAENTGRLCHSFSTYVVEEKLSQSMEGASRPTHFRGVTTVVAKLFNIVLPDVAVFGQKDFQQAAIIKRMVARFEFSGENHRRADGARSRRAGDEFAQQISRRGAAGAGGDSFSRVASGQGSGEKKVRFRRAT